MRGMSDECIDLIYLDPPFNSNANYAAPIGSEAAGAEFRDTWGLSDIDLAWYGQIADEHPGLYELLTATRTINGDSMMSYLIYMAIRIMEMKRILKDTGSLYLHCDHHASHYLKLMLDSIFGRKRFQNEIIWHYYNKYSAGKHVFARNFDTLFFYTKSDDWNFHPQREKRDNPKKQLLRESVDGVLKNKRDADGNLMYQIVTDKKVDSIWRIPCLVPRSKYWNGYKTKKHPELLRRVILASSKEDDFVLDPFCGCATACTMAEVEGRQWAGIDVGEKAVQLVLSDLKKHLPALDWEVIHRTDIPTDRMGRKSKNIRHIRYGEQEGRCNGCGEHFPFKNMTEDHIVPKQRGGADTDDNIQLLCNWCNSKKGHRLTHDELVALLIEEGVRK